MHAQNKVFAPAFKRHGVVYVARVVAVYGYGQRIPQIAPVAQYHFLRGNALCLPFGFGGELLVKAVVAYYRKFFGVKVAALAKYFNHFAVGRLAVRIGGYAADHFVALLCVHRKGGGHKNSGREFRPVGHNVARAARPLKGACNRRASARKYFNHARFVLCSLNSHCKHSVAVERTVKGVAGDEQIFHIARLSVGNQKGKSALVALNNAANGARLCGGAVFADVGLYNHALFFQFAQNAGSRFSFAVRNFKYVANLLFSFKRQLSAFKKLNNILSYSHNFFLSVFQSGGTYTATIVILYDIYNTIFCNGRHFNKPQYI